MSRRRAGGGDVTLWGGGRVRVVVKGRGETWSCPHWRRPVCVCVCVCAYLSFFLCVRVREKLESIPLFFC